MEPIAVIVLVIIGLLMLYTIVMFAAVIISIIMAPIYFVLELFGCRREDYDDEV